MTGSLLLLLEHLPAMLKDLVHLLPHVQKLPSLRHQVPLLPDTGHLLTSLHVVHCRSHTSIVVALLPDYAAEGHVRALRDVDLR
jgi:hypothetical protein